jgi:hypothetical protein
MAADGPAADFFAEHCLECHAPETRKGGLDLTEIDYDLAQPENFTRWVKIFDRVRSGEMPPKTQPRPPAEASRNLISWIKSSLLDAEGKQFQGQPRTPLRRLTRTEYENTMRDLFDLPGIALRNELPADGSAHGFDTNSDALSISHVNLAKFLEAADHILDLAIATRPTPPESKIQRVSLANQYIVGVILGNGDAVLLRDQRPDPEYPPAGKFTHDNLGAHERMGVPRETSSVGFFRHEDESFNPNFQSFAAVYPGRYRIRASFWAFGWDKGKVVPARGTEAARLSAVRLTNQGRGGGHPSDVIGYFDAPPDSPKVHEFVTWLNFNETLGFNAASLAHIYIYNRKDHAMGFTGPGIVSDWLEVEGPIHDIWPPRSHRLLFGDLPIVKFNAKTEAGVHPPARVQLRQEILGAVNRPDPVSGLWTVRSDHPLVDANQCLKRFLPLAFRRPVPDDVTRAYVGLAERRLAVGDSFEAAMRSAFRAALCSPDCLYHIEGAVADSALVDDYALACRLSYFLWNSLPDERLRDLAANGSLHEPDVLKGEVERLLEDPKSERFIKDFLGQWLKLREIGLNDPDPKLYPEFSPYLQDSMVAESRAYFRELIDQDLNASYLVKSDFAMINERLAAHYGIAGVSGSQVRRVALPPDSPRGGFLTQAAVLKVTANGTTTSPVPRGAFVMDRLLGLPPDPPPPNLPAVEPDVRGATTIREQLAKHRDHASCAACHARIDPPGFALESFDVIGGFRDRYRSIGKGKPAPRGSIDPFINIQFRLGPPVDSSGQTPDAQPFANILEFQKIIAADQERLLANLARRLATYSLGREPAFRDREAIAKIVANTEARGGGIRTLIHELVESQLFRLR